MVMKTYIQTDYDHSDALERVTLLRIVTRFVFLYKNIKKKVNIYHFHFSIQFREPRYVFLDFCSGMHFCKKKYVIENIEKLLLLIFYIVYLMDYMMIDHSDALERVTGSE